MNEDTFGELVKIRRKQLDLTQEMLAARVGCSISTIRKIEKDERRPSRQVAELLAVHLEVAPERRTLFVKSARGEGRVQSLAIRAGAVPELPPLSRKLPVHPTPFVGREQEIVGLNRMLADPYCHLITVLGPGGIGKTSLAVEIASTQQEAFSGGVYFIQLAPFSSPDLLLPAIAAALGISSTSAVELKARLVSYLSGKNILLVFDNFEHLLDGASLLNELLQQAQQLKILVTSRERLNLIGEWTFELSGLSVPPVDEQGAGVYGALQLFELHAHRIRPNLQFTGSERSFAVRICQRLGGMPLAIELAAAWVNVLSCEEIWREIERGFDFLTSTLRDASQRHRSLRAVFDHSWQRMTPEQQAALCRLAVFQGGFDREAAEAVSGAGLLILSDLVSKSMIRKSENGRFDLHEVIRQYALERLDQAEAVCTTHSRYYLVLLHES